MDLITIDGMVEHDFRWSVEDMLRLDQVDEAIERLRNLLRATPGVAELLPPRFLSFASHHVEIAGWGRLEERLQEYDRAGHPITAIGLTMTDPRSRGGPGAAGGWLAPFAKTFYFNDDAFPFTGASREDLLEGYSRDGFEWQSDYQATDATLSIKGLDDLYGAVVALEDRLLASAYPSEIEVRAGSIASCYLATLIHAAVRDAVSEKGLPRPLCVFAACDGVYPYFDAPVAGCGVEATGEPAAIGAGVSSDEEGEAEEEVLEEHAGEASLLTLFSRKGEKAPVMVLDAHDIEEAAIEGRRAEASRLDLPEDVAAAMEFESVAGDPFDEAAACDEEAARTPIAGWAPPPEALGLRPIGSEFEEPGEAAHEEFSQPEIEIGDGLESSEEEKEPSLAPAPRHSLRARLKPERGESGAAFTPGPLQRIITFWRRLFVLRRP